MTQFCLEGSCDVTMQSHNDLSDLFDHSDINDFVQYTQTIKNARQDTVRANPSEVVPKSERRNHDRLFSFLFAVVP